MSNHDAHRPVREDEDLEQIFSWQEDRKISKELTVHFQGGRYLIEPSPDTLELRGRRCRVHEYFDGHVELRYDGRPLPFTVFEEQRRVSLGDIVAIKKARRRARHNPGRSTQAGRRGPCESACSEPEEGTDSQGA